MKFIFLVTILFFNTGVLLYCQVNFTEHIISDENSSNSLNGASSIIGVDIDGDGDLDIVASSYIDDTVGWFENIDNEFPQLPKIITTNTEVVVSIVAIDIDGDGDLDIISAGGRPTNEDGRIAWHENINGNFTNESVVSTNSNRIETVVSGDLNQDGHNNILAISNDGEIVWYENLDGLGEFGNEILIHSHLAGGHHVYLEDIDNDEDLDIFATFSNLSVEESEIAWFENLDGLGNFSDKKTVSTEIKEAKSIQVHDIDGDGDGDILSTTRLDGEVIWFENLNGQGIFSSKKVISEEAYRAHYGTAGDLDNDGDLDIIYSSFSSDKIGFYENLDGNGNFGIEQVISEDTDGASDLFSIDIDQDGDIDILSASQLDDKIAWYENSTITSNVIIPKIEINIYPNPANDKIWIDGVEEIRRVNFFDVGGKLVYSVNSIRKIDISTLNSGFYWVSIISQDGQGLHLKMVKK